MAIERMKFLSMTGDESNLDFVIANNLIGSGFQPENALKVLEKGWKVTYFPYDSTIKEYIKKAQNLLNKMEIPYVKKQVELKENLNKLKEKIDNVEQEINSIYSEIEENENQIRKLEDSIVPIKHLKNISIDLEKL